MASHPPTDVLEAGMNDSPLTRLRSEYLTGLREYNRTTRLRDELICVGDVMQIRNGGPRIAKVKMKSELTTWPVV